MVTIFHKFQWQVYVSWVCLDFVFHLMFFTDAPKTLGFGIIFDPHWSFAEWPELWKQQNIAFLEFG